MTEMEKAVTEQTMWAAIQAETHTVYGVGSTQAEAIADADEWSDDVAGLQTVPCTQAAASYVRLHGGAPSAKLLVSRAEVALLSER